MEKKYTHTNRKPSNAKITALLPCGLNARLGFQSRATNGILGSQYWKRFSGLIALLQLLRNMRQNQGVPDSMNREDEWAAQSKTNPKIQQGSSCLQCCFWGGFSPWPNRSQSYHEQSTTRRIAWGQQKFIRVCINFFRQAASPADAASGALILVFPMGKRVFSRNPPKLLSCKCFPSGSMGPCSGKRGFLVRGYGALSAPSLFSR